MVEIAGFNIPDEPPLPFRIVDADLEHHAAALGYVCFGFASLELSVNSLIDALLDCTLDQRRSIVGATGQLPARCKLIIHLANLTPRDDPWWQQWRDLLTVQLNCVQNELCELRNRLVHDPWLSGEPVQIDTRPKLGRLQSSEQKTFNPIMLSERSLEAIWDLIRRTEETNQQIAGLRSAYLSATIGSQPLSLPPPLFPIRTHVRRSSKTDTIEATSS